jgi:hypothetical protein
MADSDFVKNLVIEQRRRLVGALMNYTEKNIYPHISPALQKEWRLQVMTAIGQYHDLVLDVLKAATAVNAVNEEYLMQLERIHQSTIRMERMLDGQRGA